MSAEQEFNVAHTVHLNSLCKSGMTGAAKRHRPLLEKAAADTGLTLQQVVSYYCNFVSKKDFV